MYLSFIFVFTSFLKRFCQIAVGIYRITEMV